jgi:hypothetical protein
VFPDPARFRSIHRFHGKIVLAFLKDGIFVNHGKTVFPKKRPELRQFRLGLEDQLPHTAGFLQTVSQNPLHQPSAHACAYQRVCFTLPALCKAIGQSHLYVVLQSCFRNMRFRRRQRSLPHIHGDRPRTDTSANQADGQIPMVASYINQAVSRCHHICQHLKPF